MDHFTFKISLKKTGKKKTTYKYILENSDEMEIWRLTNLMTMNEASKKLGVSMRSYQALASGNQLGVDVKTLKEIRDNTDHKLEFLV